MNWLSEKIIKFRKWIVALFVILTVIMIVGIVNLEINYNMQDYLPEDANSTKALEIMSENFDETISNANVLIPNVTIQEALDYKESLKEIEGVEDVTWLDSAVDLEQLNQLIKEDGTLETSMLDETTKDTLEGYYKDKNALFQVTIENGKEKDTVNAIYELIGEDGAMNGSAVEQASSQNLALEQTIKAISIIAPIIIIILLLSTKSWIEPFLYLTAIGVAVVINLGISGFTGEISYVTLAVAPLLQLAVSLDYAVFLSHSFDKYRREKVDVKEAMKKSMKDSLKSISASCLTTLFGFVALLFMNFKIGPDMGIALVRGVLLSFISVMTFLPALILCTYKLNDKCKHRDFFPSFNKLGKLLVKIRIPALILLVVVMIGAYGMQGDNTYIYGSGDPSAESRLAIDTAKIEETFGKSNMVVILVPVGNEDAETNLSKELEDLDYVETVMSYANTIGFEVPQEMLSEDTVSSFYSDKYARIILSTTLDTEGEEAFSAVEEIKEKVNKYYNEDEVYMCGNTVNMYDMKETVEADNARVSMITIIAIFVILLIEFKSLIIPVMLILCVKGSIWITMAMSSMTGEAISYIGYLVVSTVMMGVTIDYAILITDNYIKNRKKMLSKDAMKETLGSGIKTILVSAIVLAFAGFALGLSSSEGIVKMLGMMLGKGTVVAFLISITLLPAILVIFDKLIPKLSLGMKFYKNGDKLPEDEEQKVNLKESTPIENRKIICINREYGSGGHEIGKRVAEKLGIPFYDDEILMKAMQMSGIDENKLREADETKERKFLYTAVYEGNNINYGESVNNTLYELQKEIIISLAEKQDCVIIGRCAGDILRENTNYSVVKIFISAPSEYRIARKMKLENKSEKEVMQEIKKIDKQRKAYYEYHTGKDWNAPSSYDLTLNTSSMGIERIIAVLVNSYGDIKQ